VENTDRYLNVPAAVQNWIAYAIQTQAWERADDIHIDEIDPTFSDKTRWVEDAIQIGKVFSGLVQDTPYTVLLAVELTNAAAPTAIDQLRLLDIRHQVSYTPPSFYLFPRNHEDLRMTLVDLRQLTQFGTETGFESYFREDYDEAEGYFRVVFLLPG
jgi:hypothetical protein